MSADSIVYVVGARPNFVKMAPVLHEMHARAPHLHHVLVHTEQHYDAEMSGLFLEQLGLPQPEYLLGIGSGSHGEQTARALVRLEEVLRDVAPRCVIVPGDVNSTLAASLAASKLQIPVVHLEAGLRSFDRTMPEEINRVLVDQLSDICLIHSADAEAHLLREGIDGKRIHFVGNTMIDSLVRLLPQTELSSVHDRVGLASSRYLLVTLHRPRLVDGPLLRPVFAALKAVSEHLPVVFPVHPRTRLRLDQEAIGHGGVKVIDPVGYLDFMALQSNAAGVLTDSGGVQEETTFLNVPCFTLRANTERPITVTHGTNRVLGLRPEAITDIPASLTEPRPDRLPIPGWDGKASKRVADVLLAELDISPSATNAERHGRHPNPAVLGAAK